METTTNLRLPEKTLVSDLQKERPEPLDSSGVELLLQVGHVQPAATQNSTASGRQVVVLVHSKPHLHLHSEISLKDIARAKARSHEVFGENS